MMATTRNHFTLTPLTSPLDVSTVIVVLVVWVVLLNVIVDPVVLAAVMLDEFVVLFIVASVHVVMLPLLSLVQSIILQGDTFTYSP